MGVVSYPSGVGGSPIPATSGTDNLMPRSGVFRLLIKSKWYKRFWLICSWWRQEVGGKENEYRPRPSGGGFGCPHDSAVAWSSCRVLVDAATATVLLVVTRHPST